MKLSISVLFLLLAASVNAQNFTINDYEKQEVYVKMRDGVKLFTTIYSPKDKSWR